MAADDSHVASNSALPLRWQAPAAGSTPLQVAYTLKADGHVYNSKVRSAVLEKLHKEIGLGGDPGGFVMASCVHRAKVVIVDPAAASRDEAGRLNAVIPGCDGVVAPVAWLKEQRVALLAPGADCPGLVIRAGDSAVACAHCGWRPTAAGIVTEACRQIEQLCESSGLPLPPRSEWSAVVGPGISGPAYEVDGRVIAARDWPAGSLSVEREDTDGTKHANLDLRTAIAADLVANGMETERVVVSMACTHGDPRLRSHRQDTQLGVLDTAPRINQALVCWF